MSSATLSKPLAAPIQRSQILSVQRSQAPVKATGVITKMAGPADEVKLVVLNALGEVAGETSRPAGEPGLIGLNFASQLLDRGGNEPHFVVVKGYVKGALAWEQRLGRFNF